MPARGLRLALFVLLVLRARLGLAQEVLEDQDPIDPEWAPAWDAPFWPAPTGAVLEIAGGRQRGQVPLLVDGSTLALQGQAVSGDYVLALLTLPLGGRGRLSASGGSEERASEEGAGEAEDAGEGGTPHESPSPAQPAEAEAHTPAPTPPSPAPTSARELPAEIPLLLLQEAVERAEKAAGFGQALRSLGSIRSRARWSGLAPELRLRGATGIDQTRSIDSAGLVPSDQTQRDASDSLLEVRLTFHLEKLLHSGQEVAIERARQQLLAERAELRSAVGRELVSYVQARRRLELEFLDDEQRDRSELSAEQARLSLYLLTGGWFRGEETLERYGTRHR